MKSQLQKGLSYGCPKLWVQKHCFSTQNQSCMAKIFRHPQKAKLLMLENIVSKYEEPTPKGGWVMAVLSFEFRNIDFQPKTSHASPKMFAVPERHYSLCWRTLCSNIKVPTPKGGWVMALQSFKLKNIVFPPKTIHAWPKLFDVHYSSCWRTLCPNMKSQLQKGAELWLSKVLSSKTLFFNPKPVMHSKTFFDAPTGHYSSCWRTMCLNLKSQLQKGTEIWSDKVLSLKNQFFSPKSVMHGQKFSTPPKGITSNGEEHCVQVSSLNSKRWLSYGVTTVWMKNKYNNNNNGKYNTLSVGNGEANNVNSNTLSVGNGEANKHITMIFGSVLILEMR